MYTSHGIHYKNWTCFAASWESYNDCFKNEVWWKKGEKGVLILWWLFRDWKHHSSLMCASLGGSLSVETMSYKGSLIGRWDTRLCFWMKTLKQTLCLWIASWCGPCVPQCFLRVNIPWVFVFLAWLWLKWLAWRSYVCILNVLM